MSILDILSRWIIRKYQPTIIGVTGSVGKTSTKDAIVTVLAAHGVRVRGSAKNYNNELGVPLTIIGASAQGASLLGWLRVCLRAKALLIFRDRSYPKVLVLEMAADHPGDIRYLTTMAPPTIGVVTAVSPAHVETLGSLERIAREKATLVAAVPRDGLVVLNGDDTAVAAMRERARGRIRTFGFREENDVSALEAQINARIIQEQTHVDGITFKCSHNGSAVPVSIPGAAGNQVAYAALAATAVGLEFGMNLIEIATALRSYVPPAGRLRVLDGIKRTMLLDDTYNASPRSAGVALDLLGALPRAPGASAIVVLGDMLELGTMTIEEHQRVGASVAAHAINILVTVGEYSRDIGQGARAAGMPEDRIFHFPTSEGAGRFIQDTLLKKSDIVLIKGSQGMRMERIVKELMAEPLRAPELLVRQEASWTA
ncbi:hypothetical protein HY629_01455 [Candidatus Uhrbacteria bacterium]|nr:hypothetical protein [Candidatus Uhrbacteria bacterium]